MQSATKLVYVTALVGCDCCPSFASRAAAAVLSEVSDNGNTDSDLKEVCEQAPSVSGIALSDYHVSTENSGAPLARFAWP